MKLIHLFLVAILMSSTAYGANETIPKEGRKAIAMNSYDDLVVIKFAPTYTNSQNCSSGSSSVVVLDQNTDPLNTMASTILAAAAAGKDIGFGISGCSGAYPSIYRVDVGF